MNSSDVSGLTNEQLLASLNTVVGDERRLVARMLAYLAEVEERRLWAEVGCSSLWDFCQRRLGFSEDQTYRRTGVTELVRRFPQLLAAIASGKIHLTAAHMLRNLFTEGNVDELIAAASGKTKHEVEKLIAERAPRPDVPESIRKLPQQRAAPAPAPQEPMPRKTADIATLASQTSLLPPVVARSEAVPLPAVQTLKLEPLSERRYRIELTVGTKLHDDLQKIRALRGVSGSESSLAEVLAEAVANLLAAEEKKKRGKTDRTRKSNGPANPADISRATKREVYARDEEQCTFVSAAGERCAAKEHLQLDHRVPRARGGKGTTANLRVLCHAHNRLAAEKVFGRDFIAAKIRARTKEAPAAASSSPSQASKESPRP